MITGTLVRRSTKDIRRAPSSAIPELVAPTIFMLAITAIFGGLAMLPEFSTTEYVGFIVPFIMLEAAAIIGSGAGVNVARDIELGFTDRILVSPARHVSMLTAAALARVVRVLVACVLALGVAFALGSPFPGLDGLAVAFLVSVLFSFVAAAWSMMVALKLKTQDAGPAMQAPMILAVFLTASYAPKELLAGWLQGIANFNPVTPILTAARQGFVGDVTWGATWGGLLAAVVLWKLFSTASKKRLHALTD